MDAREVDTFWDDCPLTERVEGLKSGAAVFKETRLPIDTVVGQIESFMELGGMSEEQAVAATVDVYPDIPGGKESLRKLLAYQEQHLRQAQPS